MWITWLTMIWLKGPIFMMFWNCSYMSRRVNWPVGKEWGYIHGLVSEVKYKSEGVRVWGEWGSEGVMEWWCAGGSEEVRVCRVRVWWNDGVQEWWSEGVRACRSVTYHASTCQSTPHFHPTSVHWLLTLIPQCLPYLHRTRGVKLLYPTWKLIQPLYHTRLLIFRDALTQDNVCHTSTPC